MDTMRGKSLLGVTIAGEPWLEENVIREKKRLGKTLFMGVAAVVCPTFEIHQRLKKYCAISSTKS